MRWSHACVVLQRNKVSKQLDAPPQRGCWSWAGFRCGRRKGWWTWRTGWGNRTGCPPLPDRTSTLTVRDQRCAELSDTLSAKGTKPPKQNTEVRRNVTVWPDVLTVPDNVSFPSKSFVEKMNLFLSLWLTGYLSVSSVVHCKICRHSSCQHSQYDRLYVHQRVGCSIRDLLMGITKGKFSVLETTSVIWLYIGQRHSHIQRVWSTFGSARSHSDLLGEHCSVYWQSWAGSEQSCC